MKSLTDRCENEKEKEKEKEKETALDELLSLYVDLLNEHGPDDKRTRAFETEHSDNRELVKLMANAREVRELFAKGYL
jgi:hypothetical protein